MLKPGKFLHIRLSGIESEGTFDILQVCTVIVTHKFWEEFGIFGGENPPPAPLE